jgi:hypothetical protein
MGETLSKKIKLHDFEPEHIGFYKKNYFVVKDKEIIGDTEYYYIKAFKVHKDNTLEHLDTLEYKEKLIYEKDSPVWVFIGITITFLSSLGLLTIIKTIF